MFDHLFRMLFRMVDESLRELEKEMEKKVREEVKELEEKGQREVREYRFPGGYVRVETYTLQVPGGTGSTGSSSGSLKDRIEELPVEEEKEERRKGGDRTEEVIDVGGVPLKVESRDREWREENR